MTRMLVVAVCISGCSGGPAHLKDPAAELSAPIVLVVGAEEHELDAGRSQAEFGRSTAQFFDSEADADPCTGAGGGALVMFSWVSGGVLDATNTSSGNGVKGGLYPDLVPAPIAFEATEGWVRLDVTGPDRLVGAMSVQATDASGERLGWAEGGFDVPFCGGGSR